MGFRYARVGAGSGDGRKGLLPLDGGWLIGASARGMPYRQAWIRNGATASDLWHELASLAPSPALRRWITPPQDQQAYILQQDPDGRWQLDQWGASAGTVRAQARAPAKSTLQAEPGCFIIELRHSRS
ncbi:hypothetical protein [Massilia sp. PWRC2]|uniref:hypothetical protein n=1 Tax=Massilia sp. PWRC2 TaxID=2804626 RepID=UPI003CE799D5